MTWKQIWNSLWYNPADIRGYCLFRLCLGLLLIWNYGFYLFYMEEWLIHAPTLDSGVVFYSFMERSPFSLFHFCTSLEHFYLALFFHSVPVVLFAAGLGGRVVTLLTFASFASLCNRNPTVLFGFDEYISIFLLLFIFYPGMDGFSLRRWRPEREEQAGLPLIVFRFFQIIFIIKYFSAGLYKPANAWTDGSIIWQLLNNYEMQEFDFSFLYEYWDVFGWVSLSVKVFEIFFLPLYLFIPTRNMALWFGVLMHAGIGVFTPLMPFGLLMIACYAVFIPGTAIDRIESFLKMRKKAPAVTTGA